MLKEMLLYLTTKSGPMFTDLGYRKAVVGLKSRYDRCAAAWAPHLENSRRAILDGAARARKHDKAVLLGSGFLYDVPLAELAARFKTVVLVDAAHPRAAIKAAKAHPNVVLEEADVSGVAGGLEAAVKDGQFPDIVRPTQWDDADLLVSLNIQSQLPHRPMDYCETHGDFDTAERDEFGAAIIRAHQDWLRAHPGVVVLITDIERREVHGATIFASIDPWMGVTPPTPDRTWTWDLAPRPELFKDRDVQHIVGLWIWG